LRFSWKKVSLKRWVLKRVHTALIIILILLLVPLSPIYPYRECSSEDSQTLVALTFDDGYSSWTSTILPTLAHYNFTATGFINDPDTRDSFTWADVQELYKAGWEIGWHTAKHVSLDMATPDEIISDFENVGPLFEEHGLPTPISFAYPFGNHDLDSMKIVSDFFMAARTTQHGVNSACYVRDNPAHLMMLDLSLDVTFLEKTVHKYSQQGVLLVFLGHAIGPTPEMYSEPEMETQQFEDFVRFLYSEEQKGHIDVVTFNEGVDRVKHREATTNWRIRLDSPFEPWGKVYILPIPRRYFILYDIVIQDLIGHRYPQVVSLFDRLLYGPKHIGFFLIISLICFIVILIVVTNVDLWRNRMKR